MIRVRVDRRIHGLRLLVGTHLPRPEGERIPAGRWVRAFSTRFPHVYGVGR